MTTVWSLPRSRSTDVAAPDPIRPGLEDAGFAPETVAMITRDAAHRMASCLGADPAVLGAGALPPLWHWGAFLPDIPADELGPDGHRRRRAEMAGFPQRMWVGGRLTFHAPLRLDAPAERTSTMLHTDAKEGGSGRFWLLTVGHTVTQDGTVCIEEEQDIVLREAATAAVPAVVPAAGAPHTPWGADAWVEERAADPVLLFRFSAATANSHRIHYDHPYATQVEGYPDLVVHGPLSALLLAESARRRSGTPARAISFRARAPHFANQSFWLTGAPVTDPDGSTGADTALVRADHTVSMTLAARG
jgi:3-methylfumaryl-CoA hydratase